ncbi:MAG: AMP-binding protein, partial [Chloroflexi bacterium]|nr:AMP-binding protein [Chloroflexota bacterium]
MYIGDYLGRREIYSPDKLAIIDVGKDPELRLTYKDWNHRVNRLANWLRDTARIGFQDRVAILAKDGIEHLDLFYACGKLGAIHTALNWRLHWREIVDLMKDTTPTVLIYSDDFKDVVEQISAHFPLSTTHYLHIEGEGISGSKHYESVLQSAPDTPVTTEQVHKEDTACLLFTGGTTGLPKGAQISHRQVCWNVLNTVIHDLGHDDIYLCVFPLFHAGGLFAYISSQVVFGNTTILTREFNPEQVLNLIEREKVTVFAGVPTMYQIMTQAPNWETADMTSLRFCTSGGAPLPIPLVEKYTAEKGIRFKQGFGMTEF